MNHKISTELPKRGDFLNRIQNYFFAPTDISFLVFFRIIFGAIMIWEVFRYFNHGWIGRYYIEPQIYFTYYGFEWVKPLPGDLMYLLFFALGALAACILVGFYYRLAAILFFVGFTYVFLLDQTKYLNHFYLISLLSFLLIFLPAGRAFSVDAFLNPELRSPTAASWTLWLLRFQIGVVYFFGGIAKINGDWLRGEPMRMWLRRTDFPLIGQFFAEEWAVYGFVIGGLLFDLLIVPLLLWKRTRLYAFSVAVAFHLLNAQLFSIGIFPWFMIFATLLFFPPAIFRRITKLFQKSAKLNLSPDGHIDTVLASTAATTTSKHQFIIIVLITAYAAVQILVPVRHFLYPGDVSWTEEGHRFSWHMKLRDKESEAVFFVTDPASGTTWKVRPRKYMKSRQRRKMAAHPEMILQFSHFLAGKKREEGYAAVEVWAYVTASVNGRRPQLLVDPTVNLAEERQSLLPATWIMPLTEPLTTSRTAFSPNAAIVGGDEQE